MRILISLRALWLVEWWRKVIFRISDAIEFINVTEYYWILNTEYSNTDMQPLYVTVNYWQPVTQLL